MDNTFWLVWSGDKGIIRTYQSHTAADTEAKELATRYPGTMFYLGLMQYGYLATTEVKTIGLAQAQESTPEESVLFPRKFNEPEEVYVARMRELAQAQAIGSKKSI